MQFLQRQLTPNRKTSATAIGLKITLSTLLILLLAPLSAHAQTTLTMNIVSSTLDSHQLQGYYVALYDSGGNVVGTGFTPVSFSVVEGQTYSVQADSYGNCQFYAWGGADHPAYFDNPHTFTASPSLDLLAIYNCSGSSGTSQLTISTVDQNNNPIYGFYSVLNQSNGIVATGFTTHSFTVNNGQTYTFQVDNYGSCVFSHWTNGVTTFSQTILINGGDLGFTAVMNCGTGSVGGGGTETFPVVSSNFGTSGEIRGYYIALFQNGQMIQTGFTPATFTVTAGETYSIQADSYGTCQFYYWIDVPGQGENTIFTNPVTFTAPLSDFSMQATYICS